MVQTGMNLRLLITVFFLSLPSFALAQPVPADTAAGGRVIERIVAVVNDDVITGTDLNNRVGLAFFSSGLQPTPENKARIVPQVMRSMIDEELQRQEAKREGVTVEKADIDKAVMSLSEENKIPPDQLKPFLASRGVNIQTLYDQVEASLLWNRVVQRRLRPLVDVGEEEIDQRISQIEANAGKPEFLVAEIFLRVDKPEDDVQVQGFAQNLVQQYKNGSNFAPLAQQFSQGAGALQGGDLGWIQAGQLAPELDRQLIGMSKGQVSDPIRSPAGYHVLLVRDARVASGADPAAIKLNLKQISVKRNDGESDEQLLAKAARAKSGVLTGPSACADLSGVNVQEPSAAVTDIEGSTLASLPPWLATLVQTLPSGQVSDPLDVPGGAAMVVVCGRTQPAGGMPSRDQVLNQIGTERLELQARRLQRDLRREATVDVRI